MTALRFWLVSSREKSFSKETMFDPWYCARLRRFSTAPSLASSRPSSQVILIRKVFPKLFFLISHSLNWVYLCVPPNTLKLLRQHPPLNRIVIFHFHLSTTSLIFPSFYSQNSVRPWSVGWAHHLQTSMTHQFHILEKAPLNIISEESGTTAFTKHVYSELKSLPSSYPWQCRN